VTRLLAAWSCIVERKASVSRQRLVWAVIIAFLGRFGICGRLGAQIKIIERQVGPLGKLRQRTDERRLARLTRTAYPTTGETRRACWMAVAAARGRTSGLGAIWV
jgi:hypothetical protein